MQTQSYRNKSYWCYQTISFLFLCIRSKCYIILLISCSDCRLYTTWHSSYLSSFDSILYVCCCQNITISHLLYSSLSIILVLLLLRYTTTSKLFVVPFKLFIHFSTLNNKLDYAVPTCSSLACCWSSCWELNTIPHSSHLYWFSEDIAISSHTCNL